MNLLEIYNNDTEFFQQNIYVRIIGKQYTGCQYDWEQVFTPGCYILETTYPLKFSFASFQTI